MSITCDIGTIEDVLAIDSKISEFEEYNTLQKLNNRLLNKTSLILIAKYNGE